MQKKITKFKEYLINEEKSSSTIEKYVHDVTEFLNWLNNRNLTKSEILEYKRKLINEYAPSSVNSIISSLNTFLDFIGMNDCKVKALRFQRKIFASENKELTKQEYERLLKTAKDKGNKRLYLLMQTICATGIRVSELKFITVEAVKKEKADIKCKGKLRVVILPKKLCSLLNKYIKNAGIKNGSVFQTKNGKPLDRSNIWTNMKKLCAEANVSPEKVFPHNLRHLFARTYYTLEKDIVRLADILGHSSINTTRIYTMETGEIHKKQIEQLGLLLC